MSVKNKKFEQKRPSSSLSRTFRESASNVAQVSQSLICSHNVIKFQKKILASLFITCTCLPRQSFFSQQQNKDIITPRSKNFLLKDCELNLQIHESTLHVTKNNVKHMFPLQESTNNDEILKKQYFMLKVDEKFDIVVNSYGMVNNSKKLLIVNEEALHQDQKVSSTLCQIFQPQKLIEQAIKLRQKKLTSSVNHRKLIFAPEAANQSYSIDKLSDKKQQNSHKKHHLSASVGLNKFSDIDIKSSIRKTNICLAFDEKKSANKSDLNISIKGVEYKKSKDAKNVRNSGKSIINQSTRSVKIIKNPNTANTSKITKTKQEQQDRRLNQSSKPQQNNKKPSTTSKYYNPASNADNLKNKQNPIRKKIQKFNPMASFLDEKQNQLDLCAPNTKTKHIFNEEDSEISSCSFYTASKNQRIPQTARQLKKSQDSQSQEAIPPLSYSQNTPHLTNRNTKFLKIQQNKAPKNQKLLQKSSNINNSYLKKSITYSKNYNPDSSQSRSNISKNFSKNISQTKISQVSRALLLDKNKKL